MRLYRDMGTGELLELYKSALEAIKADCFGGSDLKVLAGAARELHRRGVDAGRMAGKYPRCPACGHREKKPAAVAGVYECVKCGALYGVCGLEESLLLVKERWGSAPKDPADERYFDFTCPGPSGVVRRHGWFNRKTGEIVQAG